MALTGIENWAHSARSANDFEGFRVKKIVVEDCLVLDVRTMHQDRLFAKGLAWYGSIEWPNGNSIGHSGTGKPVSNAEQKVSLYYRCGEVDVKYSVAIASTSCHFGGKRYWFICPVQRGDGSTCNKRVSKLYKPYHAHHFLCRHCHDLSYRSRQTWTSQTEEGILCEFLRVKCELEKRNPRQPLPWRLVKRRARLIEMARKKGII